MIYRVLLVLMSFVFSIYLLMSYEVSDGLRGIQISMLVSITGHAILTLVLLYNDSLKGSNSTSLKTSKDIDNRSKL